MDHSYSSLAPAEVDDLCGQMSPPPPLAAGAAQKPMGPSVGDGWLAPRETSPGWVSSCRSGRKGLSQLSFPYQIFLMLPPHPGNVKTTQISKALTVEQRRPTEATTELRGLCPNRHGGHGSGNSVERRFSLLGEGRLQGGGRSPREPEGLPSKWRVWLVQKHE